ncbi:DUF3488 domain-containing protein [Oxynema sp. CENA135]|uniref:transglutaminase TgpA family protein n=1 Tax=Oxynema sp. CENA135 TaxID=984206 RepID=UPI00190A2D37|nr:DUF3488 and DUF4129 domain-containing transglutaminase family protein [Oxynema sp. CENA135]MBK4731343.1 DUF3488 domain-containing protein [Oxynema sp. CENA135]
MSHSSGIWHLLDFRGVRRLRQKLAALPPPVPEHSIALRVLVQTLVIVGIIATDIAAQTQMSFWAIPLSILGAVWSWYRRDKPDIPVKFVLAIAMLLVLGAFFNRLIRELNDTRVVLAELLIRIQIIHSFDIPRRKDLGYSMVIGLILLGVAGTLSQTLAFAPLLLIFLALALPTLVLDYRSRLGLTPLSRRGESRSQPRQTLWQRLSRDLSPKRLGVFLLVTVSLGLLVFALLPRFPGYQLQTFPVSSEIEFEGEFDGRSIVNPGYARNGRGDGEDFGEGEGGDEPGEMDSTFYYGFNSRINQNLRGQMEPKVVMRVRSQAPGFWRVLAFDRYTGKGWEISRNDDVRTLDRPGWSYQFLIPRDARSAGTGLAEISRVVQSYTVVSDLPNIIPALLEPRALYFPTREVALDPEGSLRSPLGLLEGLTYTVISEVPHRDRTALGNAPKDYPPSIRDYYLDVPAPIRDRVRQLAQEILQTSPNPLDNPYEQTLYLAQYLKQNYSIPTDPFGLPFFDENEDLVESFLFEQQGGYPDHFSTVLTVMLRSIGIPARLAVGFGPGEFNPFTGLYVVRNTDAYAITEVCFPQYGWFGFDPIPGHELIPPSVEEYEPFGVLQMFWKWVAGWLPSPVTGLIQTVVSAAIGGMLRFAAWLLRLFGRGWLGVVSGLVVFLSFGLLGWLGWKGWKWWRYRRFLAKLPPLESIYRQMVDTLAREGYPKNPAQTPFEYARQLPPHYPEERAAAIAEISQAYVRWRYGGRQENRDRLSQVLKRLQRPQKGDRPSAR